MKIISLEKNLFIAIASFFLFQGCQSLTTSGPTKQILQMPQEINYEKVFQAALKTSGNRLNYKLVDRVTKDGSKVFAAEFETKKKTSFQTLEMTLHAKGDCKSDTPTQNMKLKSRGMGPGGASFDLTFCAGTQLIKLADYNRLSMSDHPHGIGLLALAQNIQAERNK